MFWSKALTQELADSVTSAGMHGGRPGVRQTPTFFGSDCVLRAARLLLVEKKKKKKERQEEMLAICLFVVSCLQPRRAVSSVRPRNPAIAASETSGVLRLTDL